MFVYMYFLAHVLSYLSAYLLIYPYFARPSTHLMIWFVFIYRFIYEKTVYSVHSVGANHDGFLNECSSDNQFIMATSPQTLSSTNFDNAFRFSHCSVRSFQQYINTLNKYVIYVLCWRQWKRLTVIACVTRATAVMVVALWGCSRDLARR